MLVLLLSLFTWLPSIIWLCLHTPLCRSDSIYSACLSLEDKDKKQKGFNRQGRSGFSWQCRPFFFLSPPYFLGFWYTETIEQDKICSRERPTISELFLRHPAEWPWRETCCGITRWENISSGKRKTTKKYQSHRQFRPREMECFADRIRFFFFFYVLWVFRAIFFSLLFRPEEKGRMQSDFKVLRMSPFSSFDNTLFEYSTFFSFVFLSVFFYLFAALLSTTHTFFVFHITLQLVSHLLFSHPRG